MFITNLILKKIATVFIGRKHQRINFTNNNKKADLLAHEENKKEALTINICSIYMRSSVSKAYYSSSFVA